MLDNTMAAYEMTLHTMNYGLNGKKAYMTIKLDMSKAYDHVERYFLKLVMEKMSFNKKMNRSYHEMYYVHVLFTFS